MFEESYTIAGKVFVLGEYAVLAGLPAILAAVPPQFKMTVSEGGERSSGFVPHPESPVACLSSYVTNHFNLPMQALSFRFEDPWKSAGGFGASTAQFAMAYMAYSKILESSSNADSSLWPRTWKGVWDLYRELMARQNSNRARASWMTPSGADLIAQWQGGVTFFEPSNARCSDLWTSFDWSGLLVFSATGQKGRKVATHEHLETLSHRRFPQSDSELVRSLEKSIAQGVSAIREKNSPALGQSLDAYADALQHAKLEVPATYEDRQILRRLPGVLGVKGAGALQSDAVLVLVESGRGFREQVIRVAQSRNLQLVSDGLVCQTGVMCLNS